MFVRAACTVHGSSAAPVVWRTRVPGQDEPVPSAHVKNAVGCKKPSWLQKTQLAAKNPVGCKKPSWLQKTQLGVQSVDVAKMKLGTLT